MWVPLYYKFQGVMIQSNTTTLFSVFTCEVTLYKTNWDYESDSIPHSCQVKIVMEVTVIAGQPSYILSALKI